MIHLRDVFAHMKELGFRLKAKKIVIYSVQKTTYLGMLWDSTTMQVYMPPSRIESILTSVKRVREGRSLTVKQFQRLLGLMVAASSVVPLGLLYMIPRQWWPKSNGFSPRGNTLCMIKVTRRCLRALNMWRQPWFLSQGPVPGASCRRITFAMDASLTGWGVVINGNPAMSVEQPPSHVAHQLPEDAGRVSSIETLSPRPKRLPCVGAHRQHSSDLLHQPPGRSAFSPQAHQILCGPRKDS